MSNLPPALQPGDIIAVTAPSRKVFSEQMTHAWNLFDQWDLRVVKGEHLFSSDGYFAGTDNQRLDDLQNFINDKSVRAIFCARGGYGASRFVDRIDWSGMKKSPKWLIGFSDVTSLHLAAAHEGLSTVHALMPAQYGYPGIDQSIVSLHDLLFNHTLSYNLPVTTFSREGEVTAEVIGGNLSLLTDSLGTPTSIETNNRILLIEEIDEYLYKVDRMLNQLKRAGKLDNLKGVIVGDFSDMKDTSIPFGKNTGELLNHYFGDASFPVAAGIPVGHENFNLALPLNFPINLKVSNGECSISLSLAS